MQREPIILLVSATPHDALEDALRQRYTEGYRIVSMAEADSMRQLSSYREQGEHIALLIYEQSEEGLPGAAFLEESRIVYPAARRLLITEFPDPQAAMMRVNSNIVDYYLVKPWEPAEQKLYPVLDELLADWRASVDMPFMRVRGIMTVRAVRIRIEES